MVSRHRRHLSLPKRCYVSIPYGQKSVQSHSGPLVIDFDRVFDELIEPAVKKAGYEPCQFRNYVSNAPIMDTTVQFISDSDAMVADITGADANIIYELGIRHAFIPTGTLVISQTYGEVPFNLKNFFIHRYKFSSESLSFETERLANAISKICADKNANLVYRNARNARLHQEYQHALDQFHGVASYDRSVFIMTKYPNIDPAAQTDDDKKLGRVIDEVREALKSTGYVGRLASDRTYHSILWKNIEVYLLGCSKGVAIVENKYGAQVNPNIAMEWGWMRASSKDVLYLLERDFQNDQADFTGFISERFSWDFPENDVKAAINRWLAVATDAT